MILNESGDQKMSNSTSKSTDVQHSIAGFYFQLLIACKEFVTIAKSFPNGYVGVEYGADITVNKGDKNYIEAKFYKNDYFTRFNEAIRHTIYNFYNTYKNNKNKNQTFTINTNVPISEKDYDFFDDWNNKNFTLQEAYLNYVKDCIIYEIIDSKPLNDKFNNFKKDYNIEHPEKKKPKYKSALIKYLHKNPDKYKEYIDRNILLNDKDIFDFIKQVNFDFPDKKIEKYESITKLNEEIEFNLKYLYPSLVESECSSIRHLIMNAFLDTTISNVNHILHVKKLNDIVKNHEKHISILKEKDILIKTMIEIERELIRYEKNLIKKGFSNQLEHILKVVSICTEQWISEIHEYGHKKVNDRYILNAEHPYPIYILNLFKAMAEVSSVAKNSLGDINLIDLEGINNLGFSKFGDFSLKTTPYDSDREDEETLITSLIEHSLKQQEYLIALGNETIILESNCEICKYDKKKIEEDIVFDIARPYGSLLQKNIYQSFDYKCISCLKLNSKSNNCKFANKLKKGI